MINFNPKISHIDYSMAFRKALLMEGVFKIKPIVIHCFFHFIQSIVKKMKNLVLLKKISKYNYEL
jgi:hypothetical protein